MRKKPYSLWKCALSLSLPLREKPFSQALGIIPERKSEAVGAEFRFEKLRRDDLDRFAADLGIRTKYVLDAMGDLIESAAAARDRVAVLPELAERQGLVGKILDIWDARVQSLAKLA
jgi:hypothetical protein